MTNRITKYFSVKLILIGVWFLTSCKGFFWYENLYARESRIQRMFQNSYEAQDTFIIKQIKICHDVEVPNSREITNSRILFNYNSIENIIKKSYSKLLPISFVFLDREQLIETDCRYFFKLPPINLKEVNYEIGGQTGNVILPILIISSQSAKRFEGYGGMDFIEDMGDDRHLLRYKLVTSIYKNDSLVYVDNRAYWTREVSERGIDLQYEVPEIIIDSLVSLSLEEYFKRVK